MIYEFNDVCGKIKDSNIHAHTICPTTTPGYRLTSTGWLRMRCNDPRGAEQGMVNASENDTESRGKLKPAPAFELQGLPVDLAGPEGLCKERFRVYCKQKKIG